MEFLDSVFVEDNHPLGTLLEQELEEKLLKCIEELPKECRAVFKKSRFEQKKYEEIADELKISVNTVKYHIKNALASIQLHMGDYLKLLILYMFWENWKKYILDYPLSFLFCLTYKRTCNYVYRRKI